MLKEIMKIELSLFICLARSAFLFQSNKNCRMYHFVQVKLSFDFDQIVIFISTQISDIFNGKDERVVQVYRRCFLDKVDTVTLNYKWQFLYGCPLLFVCRLFLLLFFTILETIASRKFFPGQLVVFRIFIRAKLDHDIQKLCAIQNRGR